MANKDKAAKVQFCSLCDYCAQRSGILLCNRNQFKIDCEYYRRNTDKDINTYWGYKFRKLYNTVVFLKNYSGLIVLLCVLLLCLMVLLGLDYMAAIFSLLLLFFGLVSVITIIVICVYRAIEDVKNITL